MTRIMYDAVTPGNIVRMNPNPQMVAGYLNGLYAWTAADWNLFPHAVWVGISVRAAWTVGQVLDVETGDATPAEAPGWVSARRSAGVDPSIYCNLATWPAVQAAFQAAGVAEPHYWIAHYDGQTAIPAGAVAKQHTGDFQGVDISSVADVWPGVDQGTGVDTVNPEQDRILREIRAQLTGDLNTGYPGWPSKVDPNNHMTITDFIRWIDVNVVNVAKAADARAAASEARFTALEARIAELKAATVAPVATVDYAAIAKAVADENDRRDKLRDNTAV